MPTPANQPPRATQSDDVVSKQDAEGSDGQQAPSTAGGGRVGLLLVALELGQELAGGHGEISTQYLDQFAPTPGVVSPKPEL